MHDGVLQVREALMQCPDALSAEGEEGVAKQMAALSLGGEGGGGKKKKGKKK